MCSLFILRWGCYDNLAALNCGGCLFILLRLLIYRQIIMMLLATCMIQQMDLTRSGLRL